MPSVVLTCDDDNVGSDKVIEAHGGTLESVILDRENVPFRRDWVTGGLASP